MAVNSWEGLINAWDVNLKRAFLSAVYQIRDTAQIAKIAERLEAGDVDGALRGVGLDPLQFRLLDKTFADAFEAGGNATANLIPTVRDAEGFRLTFQFSIRNPSAENWLKLYSSTQVREIVDDQRVMIRQHLTAGLEKGVNPRTAALDLVGRINLATGRREGGMIGLTSSQSEWVRNYAAELASDDPTAALTRELRDKRFDPAVRKAAANGEPIPAELREKMVTAYKNRGLRYRASTISRTEAMTALHQAQKEAIDQAIGSGAVNASAVTMIWRATNDRRTRDAHRGLNGKRAKVGQPFQSALGPIRFPGDPEANAANTVNCRCFCEPDVLFIENIR